VEAGYALNAPSLQWKSLDSQFVESLLQRGAGTESLFRHGSIFTCPHHNRGEFMLIAPRTLDMGDAEEIRLQFQGETRLGSQLLT
jgi:hypothetical protein